MEDAEDVAAPPPQGIMLHVPSAGGGEPKSLTDSVASRGLTHYPSGVDGRMERLTKIDRQMDDWFDGQTDRWND